MTNMLSDIVTYIRRILKTPSNAVITDDLIIDYVNRFWLMDVDARIQVFDLKTTYQFQTTPGVDQYNMPLYSVQDSQLNANYPIAMFPVYQGFLGPCFIDGIETVFCTERKSFDSSWSNYNQNQGQVAIGNGTNGPYTIPLPFLPNTPNPITFPPSAAILRGHVDIAGIIELNNANGNGNVDPPLDPGTGVTIPFIPTTSVFPQVYFTAIGTDGSNNIISDSGVFLETSSIPLSQNYGLLMSPGPAPYGNSILSNGYLNSFAITGVTQANPAVLTATTNFAVGQTIQINGVAGMIQLNGNTYTVTANGGTTVTINVDSTVFTAYTSGGTASSISNMINYVTGVASNIFFPEPVPVGYPISSQCVYYQLGIPRAILYYNNCLTLRSPPNTQYLVKLEAYLTPAAFFNTTQAIPFGYMAEYIARGAARKILSDTGDWEQFNAYEPLFKEQESLVHIRSQRQWTATRSQTIYSGQDRSNNYNNSGFGV